MFVRLCCVTLVTCLVNCEIDGAILVSFDQDVYTVDGIGDSFEVRVVVDGDDETAELDPIEQGLFSFGIKADFLAANVDVSGLEQVVVSEELDFFGFDDSAHRDVGDSFVAAEGNIDQFKDPLDPFSGTVLLTANLTNLAGPSNYPLELGFFKDLGDGEQQFVDGNGNVLDHDIVFKSSLVHVVPEPESTKFIGLSLLMWMLALRHRPFSCRKYVGT